MHERAHDTEAIAFRFDDTLVKKFASPGGGINPLHTDADCARRTTALSPKTVHGTLVAETESSRKALPRPARITTGEQPVTGLLRHDEDGFGSAVAITRHEDVELEPASTSDMPAARTATASHIQTDQALTFVLCSQGGQWTAMSHLSAPVQNNLAMAIGNVWNSVHAGPGEVRPPGGHRQTQPVSSQEARLQSAIGWSRPTREAGAHR
jgi:hypothetical protein